MTRSTVCIDGPGEPMIVSAMGYVDGMIVQWEGSQPHVAYIMKSLAEAFPNIIWKIGGKVNRTTWTGGFSLHSVGRAGDIYLDAGDPLDKRLGDLLFEMFSKYAYDFKVAHTIWAGWIWSKVKGGHARHYTGGGGPHREHVHVDFDDDHLDEVPTGFPWILQTRVADLYVIGAEPLSDRMSGLYGKAFDPKRPNVRLSRKQRHKIMLKNMGMEGSE